MKNDLQDNKAAKKLRHKQNRKRARKASRIVYSLNEHEFIITSSDSHNLNQSQNHLHVFDVFFDIKESYVRTRSARTQRARTLSARTE
jgi:hypothetical protein